MTFIAYLAVFLSGVALGLVLSSLMDDHDDYSPL